ncbi:MAG TPA: hydrogenase 4 subunit B [Alphaproteobacteria bacterium]|nr:hydrogenase 4 subunit B [Alphaproteobacteria bacterium]
MPIILALSGIAGLLGTGLLAIFISRFRPATSLVYGLSLVVSLLCAGTALAHLLNGAGPTPQIVLPVGLPWLHAHFRMDALSSFFLLVIDTLGAASSLYGISYGRHEKEPARVLPFFPLFLVGMNLVVLANDAFSFLVAWEFMSVSSWLLVLATHRERETQHAAYVYLVMATISTLALFLMFGLLAGAAGDYSFAAMRAHHLTPVVAGGVLLLALLGAGTKAGLVPLHVWLPEAHPAAPSHVSALMSGVMTKVAIYALIRILFDLIGTPQWWWGGVVLALGGITAVMGVLYALMQHDLKRLLAYHTVENIGIIVIGLGLALAFRATSLPLLAGLALTAALFHVLNHALFKSLLFFGAGNIQTATGTRDMERMGGLIHCMPATAFTFLVGAAAISALPPFNGFVSEWLTFQALLAGAALPQWLLKFTVPVVGAMLALAAALAAVCFIKVFGIVFLGRPRSEAVATSRETSGVMLAPMIVLALLCTLIGILPFAVLVILRPVVAAVMPEAPMPLAHAGWLMLIPLGVDGSSYSGLIVLASIAILASILVFGIHRLASDKIRRGAAWDCGFPDPRPETQYTSSSFAQPIRHIFGIGLFQAREKVDMPSPGDTRPARFRVSLHDPAWKGIYTPVTKAVAALAQWCNRMQFLSIRRYLSLMFAALVLLLIIVAVLQ